MKTSHTIKKPKISFALFYWMVTLLCSCASSSEITISGERQKWHPLELSFAGPESGEMAAENPFLDYRLEVVFTQGDLTYRVPGFYAADGNAAETSSTGGNVWKVRFAPDQIGEWTYEVHFKKGENIAVTLPQTNDLSAGFADGQRGTFTVVPSDKSGPDNRAKGRLNYIGEPYLQYQESGQYLIKLGVDAPENLLAYEDIDETPNVFGLRKNWQPHARDYKDDAADLVWQGGKGKNLLGAIDYLASEGLNVFSFLTFNIDGDDRNVYPYLLKVPMEDYEEYANVKENKEAWATLFHRTRFDVSKLEQWERILEYGERKGMFLHFKTHETETDHLMDEGTFGIEGKLYYRELIARFGHHLALNWNLGEENNQPIPIVREVAEYIKQLDPYQHHRVIHTFPNKDDRYGELIGDQSVLTGASLQLRDPDFLDVHDRVLKWRAKSDSTGKRWALSVDEPGKAQIALLPDDEDRDHDLARSNALWGTLMAGGFGVEWYFGYDSPHSDLTCQDFRSRDLFWDQNRYARIFFEDHLPFWQMESADDLTIDKGTFCLAKMNEIYAVYLPMKTRSTQLSLSSSDKIFSIQWYNPREGGPLQSGSIETIEGNGFQSIGTPTKEVDQDWVALIKEI